MFNSILPSSMSTCVLFPFKYTYTRTHACIYIYIYIYKISDSSKSNPPILTREESKEIKTKREIQKIVKYKAEDEAFKT